MAEPTTNSPPTGKRSPVTRAEIPWYSQLKVVSADPPATLAIRRILTEARQAGFDARRLYDLAAPRPETWSPMPPWEDVKPEEE